MPPDATAVRGQLDKILQSELFATAGRHSRLLRYVVERTLAGEGDQLKEYVLGTEVFDRDDSYDPRLDSIVRVEARRLRSRLEEYYRGPGAADPVVISIPRGSYAPIFVAGEGASNRESDVPDVVAHSSDVVPDRRFSPGIVVAAALSVAIVIVAAGLVFDRDRSPALASSGPAIAVLPFEHYSTSKEDALVVARLTDAVTTELARSGTVSVASRTSAARYTSGSQSVPEIARELNVGFVIETTAEVASSTIRLAVRLVDARLDRKVWVGEYSVNREDVQTAARRIAIEAAAAAIKYANR